MPAAAFHTPTIHVHQLVGQWESGHVYSPSPTKAFHVPHGLAVTELTERDTRPPPISVIGDRLSAELLLAIARLPLLACFHGAVTVPAAADTATLTHSNHNLTLQTLFVPPLPVTLVVHSPTRLQSRFAFFAAFPLFSLADDVRHH